MNQGGAQSKELIAEANKVEEELRRRVQIGWVIKLATLKRELVDVKGYSEQALGRALQVMAARQSIMWRNGGATLFRCGV